jgi:hypothetical protein
LLAQVFPALQTLTQTPVAPPVLDAHSVEAHVAPVSHVVPSTAPAGAAPLVVLELPASSPAELAPPLDPEVEPAPDEEPEDEACAAPASRFVAHEGTA